MDNPKESKALATNEAQVSCASRAAKAAKKMSDKQLVTRVKSGFKKIRDEIPYITELRNRFAALPRGSANIAGCKTWKTFCIEHLNRTPSAIRLALSEENEVSLPHIVFPSTAPSTATAEQTETQAAEPQETDAHVGRFNHVSSKNVRGNLRYGLQGTNLLNAARDTLLKASDAVLNLVENQSEYPREKTEHQWKQFNDATKALMDALESVNAEPVETVN